MEEKSIKKAKILGMQYLAEVSLEQTLLQHITHAIEI